jgi:hypothetical protein
LSPLDQVVDFSYPSHDWNSVFQMYFLIKIIEKYLKNVNLIFFNIKNNLKNRFNWIAKYILETLSFNDIILPLNQCHASKSS